MDEGKRNTETHHIAKFINRHFVAIVAILGVIAFAAYVAFCFFFFKEHTGSTAGSAAMTAICAFYFVALIAYAREVIRGGKGE